MNYKENVLIFVKDKNKVVDKKVENVEKSFGEEKFDVKEKQQLNFYRDVFVIGDLVMLDIVFNFKEMLFSIMIDGKVGRQFNEVLQLIFSY